MKHSNKQLTIEERIKNARKVHGNKFDYSKWNVTKSRETGEVTCTKHEVTWCVSYDNHVNKGKECPKCRYEKMADKTKTPLSTVEKRFLKKFNGRIKLIPISYSKYMTECLMYCEDHGVFKAIPYGTLKSKYGCIRCSEEHGDIKTRLLTRDEYLQRLSKFPHLDFTNTEFTNTQAYITFYCNIHQKYHRCKYGNLMNGRGCDECGRDSSTSKQLGFLNYTSIERKAEKYKEQTNNLYLFKLPDLGDNVYKIGLARSIPVRKDKLIFDFGKSDLIYKRKTNTYSAFYAERFLQNLFKDFKFSIEEKNLPSGERKRGYTELFTLEPEHVEFIKHFFIELQDLYWK